MVKENDVLVKFNKSRDINVFSFAGKQKSIRIYAIDAIDLNLSTGEFFVKNTFTGEKMKMLNDSEIHKFDSARLKNFIELMNRVEAEKLGWVMK